MKQFEVIEDNGGGLTLAIFDENTKVQYLHSGYEYHIGQLQDDLVALATGEDPIHDWEGNMESPEAVYENITSYLYGWKVVADNEGVYPDRMGAAAKREFKIE